jgi:hypothetical protein
MPYNTEANIAAIVNTIYADALLVARDNNVMSRLAFGFGDRTGLAPRSNLKYGTAAFNKIAETDDLSSQSFTPSVDQTLTPYEYGAQFFLTDSRIETDFLPVMSDGAKELGLSYGQGLDKNLISVFTSLTAGTVGGSTTDLTWANILAAITKLRSANAAAPYACVLSPEQYHCLGTAIAPGVTVTNSPYIQDEFLKRFYQSSIAGVDIYVTANIGTAATVRGAMFSSDAMALDMRRAFRIERERDSSRRGWELNASSVYAYGVWRPQYGVCIQTAGTTPV